MNAASQRGLGPVELIDQAFHLLRLQPVSALATYYLGAAPFVLGLLFFWSDMSRGAFAEGRLAPEAGGLVALFFWMNTWQALFVRQLRAQLVDEPAAPLSFSRFCHVAGRQAILQPSGLFLIPMALLLLFPIGWVYAFYQNVTALEATDDYHFSELFRKALKQSAVWPLQNNYVVFLFKGFGLFVALNIVSALLLIPYLLSALLGIETPFVQSQTIFLNTTFLAAVLALTYLCVDPVVKAVYLLRCFYGESRQSGEDLKAEFRLYSAKVQRAAILMAAAMIWFVVPALPDEVNQSPPQSGISDRLKPGLQTEPVEVNNLNRAIDQVLKHPEYTWRLPREKAPQQQKKGIIARSVEKILDTLTGWGKAVQNAVKRFMKWLTRGQLAQPGQAGGGQWIYGVRGLIFLLLLMIVLLLGLLLFRLWRNRDATFATVSAQPLSAAPNLDDEETSADQLPEEGWITLASDLLGRGELRLALRAFYLASLAHLAQRSLITLARFKSNRDYERELARRAHALPETMTLFTENVSMFDRTWYGTHEVSASLIDQFRRNVERINAT